MEGWGNLSVSNLKYSIEDKKNISLSKFIYSLGIRHIGQENAKILAKNMKNPENFFNLRNRTNFNDLLNIDGMGDTQINSIKKFFHNKKNLFVLEELKKFMIISPDKLNNLNGKLSNKTFMFTGKLQGISRAEAKSLVEKNSGKIINSVNNKLDYLITGEKPTNRKLLEAKNLNIKIIDQKKFLKMIDFKDS